VLLPLLRPWLSPHPEAPPTHAMRTAEEKKIEQNSNCALTAKRWKYRPGFSRRQRSFEPPLARVALCPRTAPGVRLMLSEGRLARARRCARAASGNVAAPPSSVMNSRRLMGFPSRRNSQCRLLCITTNLTRKCRTFGAFLRVPPEGTSQVGGARIGSCGGERAPPKSCLCAGRRVPATVLRQHNTQHLSCGDEEPRPNSA
jgi:hypothetical protein